MQQALNLKDKKIEELSLEITTMLAKIKAIEKRTQNQENSNFKN